MTGDRKVSFARSKNQSYLVESSRTEVGRLNWVFDRDFSWILARTRLSWRLVGRVVPLKAR
jgi:hypothetical protein